MHATHPRPPDSIKAYTKLGLRLYDPLIVNVVAPHIWGCSPDILVDHYRQHVTANHADIGVGTGYFLDRCRFPKPTPRVALMDLNPEALAFAAQRIARYKPETYRRNVLEPIAFEAGRFDSVGINYLLHCIPGSIDSKAVAFDHLKALMNPNAVLFGSTLLQGGVQRSGMAKRLMAVYNKKGIFHNERDDLEGLERALSSRFRDVVVQVVGCGALFSGRV